MCLGGCVWVVEISGEPSAAGSGWRFGDRPVDDDQCIAVSSMFIPSASAVL